MAESNFPYLLSNVVDVRTGKQLAGARKTLVLEHAGVRIGLMGLIEEEWLATLNCMEPGEVRYTDYVQAARELEATLRSEERCELVIALTHCRVPNDERLARECPTLDLILGGHDHDSYRKRVGPVPLIKSGTDFRELTRVVLDVPGTPGPRCDAEWNVVQITADFPEDAHAAQLVAELSKELAKTMDMVIGELGTELDFKFAHIRTQETSGSNFVADAMLAAVPGVDLAFMNSGTLRAVRARAHGQRAHRACWQDAGVAQSLPAHPTARCTARRSLCAFRTTSSPWARSRCATSTSCCPCLMRCACSRCRASSCFRRSRTACRSGPSWRAGSRAWRA